MKKLILSCCLISSLIFISSRPVLADEYHFEEIIEVVDVMQSRASATKTARKTASLKNANGTVLWSVTVTGTFAYSGSTSHCTHSAVSTSVKDTRWKVQRSSSSKSGNKATATATLNCFKNGAVVTSSTKSVTLTCDKNGKLS